MKRITTLAVVLAALASLAGCASRGGKQTAMPASNVATEGARDESMWSPPEETTMVTAEKAPAANAKPEAATSFRPNAQERPRGSVHAAY